MTRPPTLLLPASPSRTLTYVRRAHGIPSVPALIEDAYIKAISSGSNRVLRLICEPELDDPNAEFQPPPRCLGLRSWEPADRRPAAVLSVAEWCRVRDNFFQLRTESVFSQEIKAMAELTSNANIFRNLRGTWKLKRKLDSSLPGFPSGTLEGTATFTPRRPSSHTVTLELLYHEEGELKTDNGFTLKASRKYIYRYTADEDKISAWFVKEDTKDQSGKEEVDYLFHDVEIEDGKSAVVGRGEHMCSKDFYEAYYEFRMPKVTEDKKDDEDGDEDEDEEEDELKVWGLRYKVRGPQKDYTSDTAYQRTRATEMPIR